jgi:uncharacterized SAM-binding protein YcdF (DUF218 family)
MVLCSCFVFYLALWVMVGHQARLALAAPPAQTADVALVLGSRAYWRGAPNRCTAGRVDRALALARAGQVHALLVSGGIDHEDGRIEAREMARYARAAGWKGALIQEPDAQSTRENLAFARPLLEAAGARRVVIVSEPYHLWRAEGLDRAFALQYAAARTLCWRRRGMFSGAALREALAVAHNALVGAIEKPI